MDAGGGQAQHHVARHDVAARQEGAALGGPDAEARQIVIRAVVETRHFGGLAADQRAAGDPATRRDAAHDVGADPRHQLGGGEIVEEEQGLGALHDDVVDAHRHEVDPDRVVAVRLDGDLHLGADAVIGRHQDRVLEAGGLQVEQPAEPTDLGIRPRPAGGTHQRLDRLDHGVAGIDVDARLRVGHSVCGLSRHPRRSFEIHRSATSNRSRAPSRVHLSEGRVFAAVPCTRYLDRVPSRSHC
jgi:hypothetical protein